MMAEGGVGHDIDVFEDDSDIDIATKEYDRLRQSRIKVRFLTNL